MYFKKLLIYILILFVVPLLNAKVYIIKSFDYKKFDTIIEGIQNELYSVPIKIFKLYNFKTVDIEDKETNICFTLGETAYKYISNHYHKIKIIALMVFNELLYQNDNRTIYIKPALSLKKRILLLKKVLKNLQGIIIPCSQNWYNTNHYEIEKFFKDENLSIKFVVIKENNIAKVFKQLIVPKHFIVLSVYDREVYNQNNIFFILRMIYEKKLPFVGFSVGFIKNGSFLAIESDYYKMGKFAAQLIKKTFKKRVYYINISPYVNIFLNSKSSFMYDFDIDMKNNNILVVK